MESITSSNVHNVSFGAHQAIMKKPDKATAQNEKKDKEGLNKALIGLGIAALATIGIAIAANKSKTFKLDDINFDNGKAFYKKGGGKKFTGVISDTKAGNNIKMKYKNGVLQESIVEGEKNNFKKVYHYDDDGNLIKVIKNEDEIDIEKLKKEALDKKAKQEASKPETHKTETLSSGEEGGVKPENASEIDAEYQEAIKQGEKWSDEVKKAKEAEEQKLADEALERAIGPKANIKKEEIDEYEKLLKKEEYAQKLQDVKKRSGNLKERMEKIKKDHADDLEHYTKEKLNKRINIINKTLTPEQISALGDEQIWLLATHRGSDTRELQEALEIIKQYKTEKLRKISVGIMDCTFIGNMFDAAKLPQGAERNRVINFYRKK